MWHMDRLHGSTSLTQHGWCGHDQLISKMKCKQYINLALASRDSSSEHWNSFVHYFWKVEVSSMMSPANDERWSLNDGGLSVYCGKFPGNNEKWLGNHGEWPGNHGRWQEIINSWCRMAWQLDFIIGLLVKWKVPPETNLQCTRVPT